MPGIALHKVMWVHRTRTIACWFLALLVAASIGVLLAAKRAHAVTFTVNSTGDELATTLPNGICDVDPRVTVVLCTLREALEEVNANDNDATVVDTIKFNIPSSTDPNCNANTKVCTISPGSGLPIITAPVIIDGYTQRPCSTNPAPCSKPNASAVGTNAVLLIRLDGNNAGFATGLNITANDSVVRGLSITRFSLSAGITLSGADNTRIEGNFLGTSPGGTQKGLGNGWGLFLQRHFIDSTNASSNNTVCRRNIARDAQPHLRQ
jgi:hypothetical protein